MSAIKTSTLALSLLVALGGCNRTPDDRNVPMPATQAPAATAPASRPAFDIGDLDTGSGACTNLDTFVNAKWAKANPIPPDKTSWGVFDELLEKSLATQRQIIEAAAKQADKQADPLTRKLGLLYASGMDEAAIEAAGDQPIRPQLEAIAALDSSTAIADYITKRYAEGDALVFEFGAGPDFHKAEQQIGFAGEGGLGLPTKDYYTAAQYAPIRAAYLAYIAKSFELTGSDADTAKRQAKDVMTLESRLAAASLAPTDARQPKNQYHFLSVADADKITPHFSWTTFFAAQGVDVGPGFSLSQPRFFAAFDQQLATAPVAQWQAYLRFHTIDDASRQLSKAFVDNNFAFYGKTLSGQPEQRPRWKRVLGAVNVAMGEGLGQLYVAKVFTPDTKQRAAELVDNIRAALKTRIEHVDWMSEQTKAKALAKWETFLPNIGYPDTWRDWSGLDIVPGAYYRNLQAAAKFNYHYDIAQIGKPTDRKRWTMTPQTVNAYYSPQTNTINFQAAILQPPFFDANADDALNYGAIGAVIGHEASHGFDDQGSQFDGAGNNVNWWTPQDRKAFEARTDLLVKQFDAYVPLPNHPTLHVNGKLTLGENIADLGGINIAYDALQTALRAHPERAQAIDGYRPEQRFFLGFARNWRERVREQQQLVYLASDPHSPSNLRAIASPSNMPQFAQAFSCKAGDAMVRPDKDRVVIW
ncbi:M13 family metallopeptidase [Xanthomonas phaseoli]|uniref:M13 family metallopeptidase n=1 Tax=Xanthomonas phaseoli TaxID=1985254 RepID=UPI00070E21FC|nr:M13 family metallopeptidase [Xanthomonas phaseoli]MBO9786726.1 M13 family metallopeptidase [Xanthomonas phaseoli pv. dieffenbachiae]MBO9885413.1 M13 family metallopeptidase [Xanthomonas phaseoli pv. dieffenbachiae]MBO9913933.1 M13 family metallopeptidase [Xanthomonas phaseoli pv. dieffenbachiae]MBO9938507.1 M13 family metallopeptidase [Xanthomonas phaseoli pv. dieffenbachiae]MBO9995434.1 M13 family metallopeptidase [Xanthomonas phaseoli pv. dieffenbachiae]